MLESLYFSYVMIFYISLTSDIVIDTVGFICYFLKVTSPHRNLQVTIIQWSENSPSAASNKWLGFWKWKSERCFVDKWLHLRRNKQMNNHLQWFSFYFHFGEQYSSIGSFIHYSESLHSKWESESLSEWLNNTVGCDSRTGSALSGCLVGSWGWLYGWHVLAWRTALSNDDTWCCLIDSSLKLNTEHPLTNRFLLLIVPPNERPITAHWTEHESTSLCLIGNRSRIVCYSWPTNSPICIKMYFLTVWS